MDKTYRIQFLEEQIAIREERLESIEKKKAELDDLRKELEKLECEVNTLDANKGKDENDIVELKLWLENEKREE